MRWVFVLVCAVLGWPRTARAQTVSLAAPQGVGCPTEAEFREMVDARLERSAKTSEDATVARVRIAASDAVLVGSVELSAPARAGSARAFESTSCAELADALALAVALFIEEGTRGATPPVQEARGANVTRAAPSWVVGPALGVGVGDGHGPSLVPTVFGDFVTGRLRVSAEGHAVLPTEVETGRGVVRSRSIGGLVATCLGVGPFFGCTTANLDALTARGQGVTTAKTSTALTAALGLRAGAAFPLSRWFVVRGAVDALYVLTPNRVAIDDVEVYEYPAGIVRVTLGAGASF